MKLKFKKLPPQKIIYGDYLKFDSKCYVNDIEKNVPSYKNNLQKLNIKLEDIMNKHAPQKTKLIRRNNQVHVKN